MRVLACASFVILCFRLGTNFCFKPLCTSESVCRGVNHLWFWWSQFCKFVILGTMWKLQNTLEMSCIMRKPDFCLCENKGADQLRTNCEADQRLCFRYRDGTIPLLLKSEISSFYPSSVAAQTGLCQTWSETPKTRVMAQIILERS